MKFERGEKPLSERRNIVVMADETHRGQYGFDEKIVVSKDKNEEKRAHVVIGNARIIHDALPNATFIGFTGTPISSKDRNTSPANKCQYLKGKNLIFYFR